MRPLLGVSLGLTAAAMLLGCGDTLPSAPSGKLPVLATTGMIADAVQRVGGDFVEVETLMGPGIDPHRYIPTAGDIGRVGRARVVFFNGLHLEGKMADVLEQPGRSAVAVTRDIPVADLRTQDGEPDPHVWFDVKLWARTLPTIADALADADPAHAADYRANAAAYAAELTALHEALIREAQSLPPERRVLVTSHDAFGYFGAAYGFEVHGLQGVSTASETTTRDVQELARLLGSRQVPAVFAETSVPPKGLQAVLDAVRGEYGHAVRLVGGDDALFSDALGPAGGPGETYPGMVRHNMRTITGALKP